MCGLDRDTKPLDDDPDSRDSGVTDLTTVIESESELSSITFESPVSSTRRFAHGLELMSHRHEAIMRSLEIECAVSETDKRLIGDKSRRHVLPTLPPVTTKHPDLNSISPATLKSLMDGQFDDTIPNGFAIIDSRYPYEFEAGHIRGAVNLFTKESLVEWCFSSPNRPRPSLLIFHCEFSSERGPNMLRFLRSHDRDLNRDHYPSLFFPELYILDGGYKKFFSEHSVSSQRTVLAALFNHLNSGLFKDYCEPRDYKPMLHREHLKDLKHFRAKTKTWEMVTKQSSVVKSVTRFRLHRCPRSTLF